MASPTAAQRVWPRCRGPVGLAEMNSTLILVPANVSLRPYDAPAATTSAATLPWAPAETVMFRKPGPAMSTLAMPSVAPSASARVWASSRGGMPAFLASWRATLVA